MKAGNVLAALACIGALGAAACRLERQPAHMPRVIVLGVDGMDPGFVERHWDVLPNLAQLRARGSFSRLGTTMPPQSPVAWSSFITGRDPDAHGIFDFVQRDPATMQLYSSMGETEEPRHYLPLGPYVLPLSSARVISFRRGTAFWQTLAQRHVPVAIMRMPTNYPPLAVGRALAGMGTPDLRGTLGTFTFYTDDPEEISRPVAGGLIVKVALADGHVILPLEGPPNSLRKDHAYASVNLAVDVDPVNPVARVRVGDAPVVISQGEWTGWMTADFPLIPHIVSTRGMFRIFAKQFHPRFELYISPINVDPESPALPVAQPPSFGRDLARAGGRFYTLGIPEDTSALRQDVFNLAQFLRQTRLVFADEHRLLRDSLRASRSGLLFFYFSSIDQNSHILWGRHEAELLEVYREVDAAIGEAMRSAPSAELIVLSDHGFASFDRAVHLNAWLRDHGYLALRGRPGDETTLGDLDWAHTQAYALGLNGLYVNLRGREQHGIVEPGRPSEALIAHLREQLLAFRDPANGRPVITAVYESRPAKENAAAAPDLIVGYAAGDRGSWQTGLGGTPAVEIEDNNDPWIGDHCMDPAAVPGVLFTSRPMALHHPRLQDVAGIVLKLFGG
ncbi:MAG TPA: alkaline phosphatase family protein [Bryobacteraceae bacterium]|nr:alkaline phosphatase family protein [Bryobacteraceae bacterium]